MIICRIARLSAAAIMLQTLYFKFMGAEESVYIFSTLGFEPLGRYLTGLLELIASIALLIPRSTWIGALFGFTLMTGAILAHFVFLGIEVMHDSGLLFCLAATVWMCCAYILIYYRNNISLLQKLILSKT
jgi:uncharacterized membrane protein YphA (DoxX/SURF4 family)